MATPTTLAPLYPEAASPEEVASWKSDVNRQDKRHTLAVHVALGFVLVVCTAFHIFRSFLSLIFHNRPAMKNWIARSARALRAWLRKYLIYYTVPTPYFFFTGGEVLLIALYILTVIILAFSQTEESPVMPGTSQILDGFSSRCAYLFVASLPWIVALSMKNNAISFLTGVPYERLQIYHRSLARIGLLLVLAHTITKLTHNRHFHEMFRRWGMAGFVIATCIWLSSTRNFQRKGYQLFVHGHVIMLLGLGVCIWQHTSIDGNGDRIHIYLLITAGIWVAERVTRLLSLIKVNISCWKRRDVPYVTRSTGMILSRNMLRLEVVAPGLRDWSPGQHVYLTSVPLLRRLSFIFEAHPFTIASIPPKHFPATTTQIRVSHRNSDIEMQMRQKLFPASSSHARSSSEDASASTPKMVFFILARGGFTKRLYDRIQSGQSLDILVYGPYSRPTSLFAGYESVIIFAGGSGVSWALPLLLQLCRQAGQRRTMVKQIVWIWSVASSENIPWITKSIASALETDSSAVTLDIRVYISQEHAHRRQPPREWTDVASGKQRAPWIVQGQPNIKSIVQGSIENAMGRVWMGVCGPTSMALTVRSHARMMIDPRAVLSGDYTRDITIHVETFGW